MQRFTKFPNFIFWSKFDNLICGDTEKRLTDDTRYRRLLFTIIPDQFKANIKMEQEYVQKFHRLLEYIMKQHQKDSFEKSIDIITSTTLHDSKERKKRNSFNLNDFVRCTIPLVKGKRENYEWFDLLLESSFDTRRSYHICIHWLVASSTKVDAHIQLLFRRCSQYGLNLVNVPHDSMASSIFLHPLICPPITPVRDGNISAIVCSALIHKFSFVNDGEYFVNTKELGGFNDFDFTQKKKYRRDPNATQFIHGTGLVFVRSIHDNKGWTLFLFFVNRREAKDELQIDSAHNIIRNIKNFIEGMKN